MNLLRILFIATLAGYAIPCHAVGLAIQPARLELAAEWGSAASGEILVTNVTNQPAMYTVRNPAASDVVQVRPSSFRLDPADTQLVTVRYAPRGISDRQVSLEVVANPLAGAPLTLASGVRYPLELVATGRWWWGHAIRGLLLAIVVGIAAPVVRRRFTPVAGMNMPAE